MYNIVRDKQMHRKCKKGNKKREYDETRNVGSGEGGVFVEEPYTIGGVEKTYHAEHML